MGTLYSVSNIGTMIKTLYSEEYQILTKWLKEQRTTKGLTMRDLAQKLDVPHSFIGKVEQCERKLDIIEYIKYCEALEVSAISGIQKLKST